MRDEALAKIRTAKIRRLEIIEEQIATHGEANAPPELVTERDDLKHQLGFVEVVHSAAHNADAIDDDTRRLLRRYDQQDLNLSVLANLVQRVTTVEEWLAFDRSDRGRRQLVLNLWLGVLTILLIAQLIARFF